MKESGLERSPSKKEKILDEFFLLKDFKYRVLEGGSLLTMFLSLGMAFYAVANSRPDVMAAGAVTAGISAAARLTVSRKFRHQK